MNKTTSVKHHIQQYIIDHLSKVEVARFRDLRPPKTDTNLVTYHLGSLVKNGLVDKLEAGYSLSGKGYAQLDGVDSGGGETNKFRPQIVSMLVVQNDEGDILLQRRPVQPYINTWGLPVENVLAGDDLIEDSINRLVSEELGLADTKAEPAGDCYIRVKSKGRVITTTLAHVFRLYADDIKEADHLVWARPHKLAQLRLAPATEDIMTRTFFKDPFYFEEYEVNVV